MRTWAYQAHEAHEAHEAHKAHIAHLAHPAISLLDCPDDFHKKKQLIFGV